MKSLTLLLSLILSASTALAEVKVEEVNYKDGNQALRGYVAYDDSKVGKLPGVIVFHDWMGVGDFVKNRAKQLAEGGYVAFVADVYGKGVVPKDQAEAGKLATEFKSNRPLMQQRGKLALAALSSNAHVDTGRIAAIGFCFGGTAALELARSGAPLKGVVSFHGGLGTPNPAAEGAIKGKILALHGADDPLVPADEVAAFENEMRAAHVDWELVKYGNSVHAFTNPAAGTDNSKGAAYNASADARSAQAMTDFFKEIF